MMKKLEKTMDTLFYDKLDLYKKYGYDMYSVYLGKRI